MYQLVKDIFDFNRHLVKVEQHLYWQENHVISALKIFDTIKKKDKFISQSFILDEGPLYRFGLFKLEDKHYHLVLIVHHVLLDGSSFDEFIECVSDYYNKTHKKIFSINKQRSLL